MSMLMRIHNLSKFKKISSIGKVCKNYPFTQYGLKYSFFFFFP